MEILSNGNLSIIVLINYKQRSLNVYQMFAGKLILLQKMYLQSESVKTFMISNRFYFLSYRLGFSSIYKWKNSNFILIRNFSKKFNYLKSENDLIITVENDKIQFYTKPEMIRISSEYSISNHTDLMIYKENLIEFYIEKYRMTIKFQKFELKKENKK